MCLSDMPAKALATDGYIGMTARNDLTSSRAVDLKSLTVINMDPNAYKDETDLIDPASDLYKQLAQDLIYTDDLGNDAVDVLDKYASQVERQIEYLRVNLGSISSEDSQAEMLFKMIEQIKHVNYRVTGVIEGENFFEKELRRQADKPRIFRSFYDYPD